MSNVAIFVFSYNRGRFLLNCLKSIEKANIEKAPVYILDDNSSDQETKQILERAGKKYSIYRNDLGQREFKTGGLCGSMNKAMQIANKNGHKIAIFVQDDMQLVRRLTRRDFYNFECFFKANQNAMQLSTCFFPVRGHEKRGLEMLLDPVGVAWVRRPEMEGGKSYFSDVGVFDVDRFFERLGLFHVGEQVNAARCAEEGLFRGLYRAPFMHWLPFPKSFRGGKRSFVHAGIEFVCGAGLYPYTFWEESQEEPVLKEWGDPAIIAERALLAPSAPRSKYWTGGGGVAQLEARGGWRFAIFKSLQNVRHALQRK